MTSDHPVEISREILYRYAAQQRAAALARKDIPTAQLWHDACYKIHSTPMTNGGK